MRRRSRRRRRGGSASSRPPDCARRPTAAIGGAVAARRRRCRGSRWSTRRTCRRWRTRRRRAPAKAARVDSRGGGARGTRARPAALVSAGHTGATVMAAHTAFGMLPGVDRPALAHDDSDARRPAVLLDAGATVECRPHHLLQFAVMGGVYARVALGIERPRVGLLSIGEEETKGNELTRDAHRLLKASPLHFIGNVEGREIYSGHADVIVCDGFTGNVALKTSEGLVETVEDAARRRAAGHVLEPGRLPAVAARIPPVPPPRRLLGIRRGAAARRGRRWHRRPRAFVGQGGPQRHRRIASRFASRRCRPSESSEDIAAGRAVSRRLVIAFIFPGRVRRRSAWARRWPTRFPRRARVRGSGTRRAWRRPLSRIVFDGPDDG